MTRWEVVNPELLDTLLAGEDGPVLAELRLAEAEAVVVVPSAAVLAGTDGSLCVWVSVEDERFVARTVEAQRDDLGSTALSWGVDSDDLVLVNPREILRDATCP